MPSFSESLAKNVSGPVMIRVCHQITVASHLGCFCDEYEYGWPGGYCLRVPKEQEVRSTRFSIVLFGLLGESYESASCRFATRTYNVRATRTWDTSHYQRR